MVYALGVASICTCYNQWQCDRCFSRYPPLSALDNLVVKQPRSVGPHCGVKTPTIFEDSVRVPKPPWSVVFNHVERVVYSFYSGHTNEHLP